MPTSGQVDPIGTIVPDPAIRIAVRRSPPGDRAVVLFAGSIELGRVPLRLTPGQLPAAIRLVGEGLEAIADRLMTNPAVTT